MVSVKPVQLYNFNKEIDQAPPKAPGSSTNHRGAVGGEYQPLGQGADRPVGRSAVGIDGRPLGEAGCKAGIPYTRTRAKGGRSQRTPSSNGSRKRQGNPADSRTHTGVAPPRTGTEGEAAEGSGSRRPPGTGGGPHGDSGLSKDGREVILPGSTWDDYDGRAVV